MQQPHRQAGHEWGDTSYNTTYGAPNTYSVSRRPSMNPSPSPFGVSYSYDNGDSSTSTYIPPSYSTTTRYT